MTASHTCTTASGHSINLIDKYDTRCIFLGILKQITDTRSSNTDKHFYEIGTRNTKERYSGLACNGFCQKCLTGSRRSD